MYFGIDLAVAKRMKCAITSLHRVAGLAADLACGQMTAAFSSSITMEIGSQATNSNASTAPAQRLGHRRGKPAMSEALHGAVEAFEFLACEPISMVIELENAAVMVFTRGVSRVTGRSVRACLRISCASATARSSNCGNSWIPSMPPNRRSGAS